MKSHEIQSFINILITHCENFAFNGKKFTSQTKHFEDDKKAIRGFEFYAVCVEIPTTREIYNQQQKMINLAFTFVSMLYN
jgi:hypothetical protein